MASKQPSTKIKVCLVAISLGRGGAERATALLSRMLHKKGFNVSIAILNDMVDYPYEGKLFNLGALKTEPDTLSKRLARFKKLKAFFKEEQFDYIIDTRSRGSAAKDLFYLHYLYKKQRIIYVVHSFNIFQYFPKQQWLAKKMINKAEAVVGVSKAISEKINTEFETNKAITIYNPSEPFSEKETENPFSEKYILYLGRIEEKVKNFTLLLEGYKASKLSGGNIYLKIVGDGPDVDFIQQKIQEMGLSETVTLYPFTPAILPYVKNALYLTLTSRYEGFPMVLIEALSVGTPVLSVHCESGPDEIIVNKNNGLLIENHSVEALSEAMNTLAFDEDLYKTCKESAPESISHLTMDAIAEKWATVLKNKHL
ncbi:glycosyltransferase [Marixanthomonas ophiurae]|uniref:Glycosyltransferase family 4 protein n=1 Tax=Marixanthomonas ophiurae TaxID=387659 RepID=A0A3E1Q8V4_9FLAO|nr:glycosyltransferase [Marixanthomonas ophiurae]RFN58552.1 glycosyltransferase family 4 protein [Marixanthomonas ophiurae]